MNLAKRAATLLISVYCLGLTNSAFSEIYFKGYAKTYSVYAQAIELGSTTFSDEQFQQQSALRLMWAKEWSGAQFEFHYDVQPIAFSSDAFQASLTSNAVEQNPYRIDDLSLELGVFSDEREHHQTFQNLDRLNLQWQFEQGDLTVGRQAIGFGSARFVNPSDVLLPFSFQTLNQEYRVGIDAVRYQTYIHELALFDIGYVFSKYGDQDAAFARMKLSQTGTDWDVLVMEWEDEIMLSAGIQSAWGDMGWWFESGYFIPEDDERFFRFSTGWDYALRDDVIVMMEYHRNGSGNRSGEYPLTDIMSGPLQSAQLGQDYIFSSLSWTVSALWMVSPIVYWNLNDRSVLVQFNAETSWNDDLYSQFGFFSGWGKQSESVFVLESEYGESPLTVYASLGWYF